MPIDVTHSTFIHLLPHVQTMDRWCCTLTAMGAALVLHTTLTSGAVTFQAQVRATGEQSACNCTSCPAHCCCDSCHGSRPGAGHTGAHLPFFLLQTPGGQWIPLSPHPAPKPAARHAPSTTTAAPGPSLNQKSAASACLEPLGAATSRYACRKCVNERAGRLSSLANGSMSTSL